MKRLKGKFGKITHTFNFKKLRLLINLLFSIHIKVFLNQIANMKALTVIKITTNWCIFWLWRYGVISEVGDS